MSFEADARPAVLLIREEVLGALDICDDVASSGFEGSGAGLHGALDVHSTLHSERFGAFIITNSTDNR